MNLFPDIEKESSQAIADFQSQELTKALTYAGTHSPFYKKHFAAHGFNLENVKSVADLPLIPPTGKDDIQKYNWDFLCVPREKIIEYASTSGTLGKPVTIALTESDLQRLAYNEAISFACAGLASSDTVQLMLTLDRQFMAGIAYHEGARKLGAGIVRMGPGLPALQWQTIHALKPTVLIAVPSFILKLIDFAIQNNIDYQKSSVRTLVCIGEGIRQTDLTLNALGERIKNAWDVTLISTYASTEMQTAFTECVHGKGGHLHPELLIVEILNDENVPVNENEIGEVTITTLGVEGMPLIRYKTGDLASVYAEPCACGRNTLRLSPLAGRKQQMLKVKGTTLYPQAFLNILQGISGIRDFVAVAGKTETGQDDLTIHVCTDSEVEIKQILQERFKSVLRILPEIKFVSQDVLDRIQSQSGSRKLQKFIDNR